MKVKNVEPATVLERGPVSLAIWKNVNPIGEEYFGFKIRRRFVKNGRVVFTDSFLQQHLPYVRQLIEEAMFHLGAEESGYLK